MTIEALQQQSEPPCATGSQCVGNKCERCEVQEREWQGLTDEEIEQGMKQAYSTVQGRNLEIAFARAIEAKLREKNFG
jgi:hypothetical protein